MVVFYLLFIFFVVFFVDFVLDFLSIFIILGMSLVIGMKIDLYKYLIGKWRFELLGVVCFFFLSVESVLMD